MSNRTTPLLPEVQRYGLDDFGKWADRRQQLFLLCAILPGVVLPIVGLRLFTSIHIVGRWHVDDTLIVIATVFTLAQSILGVFDAEYGAGEHIIHVPLEDLAMIMKISTHGGVITYNLATLFIKVSILFFYLRFAVQQSFRWVVYAVIFVVTGYSISASFGFLYGCNIPGSPACQRLAKVFLASAILNVVTDMVILLLPIWLIWSMRLRIQYKIAVALIMMGGGFVVAVSIIRLVATLDISMPTDPTYSFGLIIMRSVVEAWVGLVCACLPCLKAFFSRYLSHGLMQRFFGQNNFRFPSIGLIAVNSSHSQRQQGGSGAPSPSDGSSRRMTKKTSSTNPSAPTPPPPRHGRNSFEESESQRGLAETIHEENIGHA
ncbi:hypothetical protein B0T11DRAFT_273159 [Plectosphaerella cucumerina]|uniref:Rhodopsin domain-containing protein n=1 Tax=Plectosphaerella cucumerina TaxID=40658 RepID=A0A8K0TR31_9PEZI|nr:hypothetical protein B0T11DRAFT_273159 [Plectosphaerella cucumerina]